ncbi:MAG: polysaccharide export protein [Cyanobacteria bacterium P01_D01_bin.156]
MADELPELPRVNIRHSESSGMGSVISNQHRHSFASTINGQDLPFSPGDRIRLRIPGVGGEAFSGDYEISFNGILEIPFIEPILAAGLSPSLLQEKIRLTLLDNQFFQPDKLRVSVQTLEYSPVHVSISGAVFQTGRLLLSRDNSAFADTATLSADISGDYPLQRYLTSALKATGGIKPNADISQISVIRDGVTKLVDLSGIFSGSQVTDYPLIAGDEVVVPDSGVFQDMFVQPSQITPDSVDLYISNLTEPVRSRSLEGSGDINVSSFKYGANLVQVLVASGCVGGTRSTNAARQATLIQSDLVTEAINVSEYRISTLVREGDHSRENNPLLMPDDAIACYDSRNTDIRGIFDTVTDFLSPINILRNILR